MTTTGWEKTAIRNFKSSTDNFNYKTIRWLLRQTKQPTTWALTNCKASFKLTLRAYLTTKGPTSAHTRPCYRMMSWSAARTSWERSLASESSLPRRRFSRKFAVIALICSIANPCIHCQQKPQRQTTNKNRTTTQSSYYRLIFTKTQPQRLPRP